MALGTFSSVRQPAAKESLLVLLATYSADGQWLWWQNHGVFHVLLPYRVYRKGFTFILPMVGSGFPFVVLYSCGCTWVLMKGERSVISAGPGTTRLLL